MARIFIIILAVIVIGAGVAGQAFAAGQKACQPQSQERAVRCPKDMVGKKIEQSDFDCARGEWGPWYAIVDKCVRCVPVSKTRLMRCPANQKGQITQRSDYKCPAMRWTGWYEIANSCD